MSTTVEAVPAAGPTGSLLALWSKNAERSFIGMTGPADVLIGGLLRQWPQDQTLRIHIIS